MKLKSALACTFAALTVAGGAAGTAQAADDDSAKFDNSSQVLSCDVIEVIDLPILSAANNNIDCSHNVKEEEHESVHIVDEDNAHATAVILPKGHKAR
ncbi:MULTISPECIES: hypothetical protein [Streptomyces]|uniref:Secreted protein n=1 Tax=Streptomyces sudanensis TaxID=436397 RepID=A0ABY4TDA9_9ACTN|nr:MULTISPECIES: hypothetical protein [Streptomyces]MCP9958376.1 hypothetical protein [Streptomyces sudanensis]MCP9987507.1 hypothetical protein [Streptomyces sudanensis]MCQ0001111.1 hypothetical protein [Streptomyces sudanensis]URN16702.1 hypothetical protein MW084_12945 [Streptomyces sudanensis]